MTDDTLFATIAGAALLVVVGSVLSTLRQYFLLGHISGPTSAGFSKWWLARAVRGGRSHLDFYEVCQKYGSVARVGPCHLITSDPDLMKRMLNVRTAYKRSDWYDGMRLDPAKDNVLSMRNDALHSDLRSKMAAGYSGKEVDNLEARIDQNILALVDLLESKYVSLDKPFDFGRKAQYFTLDVISDLAFGRPFGDLATDSDVHEYISTSELNMPSVMLTTVFPWLMTLLAFPLFKSVMPSEKDAVGIGRTMAIAKEVASERFGPHRKVQKDMLGSFVARGLTQSEAESEILMQILAGSDTTATAIRATLLHIITNPRVLNKLLSEIESADPGWPVISDAAARRMPYLQAVVKEGLRIWPPVVGLMAKEVPQGGDTFKGVFLPEGTRIGYCAWGIFRKKEVWGQDADEFKPERWMDASPTKRKEMDETLDLVFGYGRWQCLGRNVAQMELNKIFVEVRATLAPITSSWFNTESISC
ncbi:hypothetical protein QQS21_012733 [Conoideocrella luteorostrata]|uniref:Pisatin demethylase n=1 Tax=Conoideocrella luteorostrata TaxID=1105319 RepID=A0AAJ0FUJ7_9HYPO|nr:hypothetical protein QQS21_012733 [Conoideocrella luteorostrata]